MALLTKSLFLSSRQCLKRLWYEVHQPLDSPAGNSMAVVNGRAVDRVARRIQPGRVVTREQGLVSAVEQTRRFLDGGESGVLYQAAFRDGELAAVTDIVRTNRARVELIEIKASTAVTEEHFPDITFQTLVLQRAGLSLASAYIGHVNSRFVLRQPDDYAGLLIEADVTSEVRARLPSIAEGAAEALSVMGASKPPDIPMGDQCTEPHPCPFTDRCATLTGTAPEYPLAILPRGGKTAARLAADGYTDLREVPADRLSSPVHQRVHAATASGMPVLNRAATVALRRLQPPFAYLDFETMNFAVPEIIGTRPYEQCPFQYSLHIDAADGTGLGHVDYLEVERFGDVRPLAMSLLERLPSEGPVFVYNQTLEKGALALLARLLPDLAQRLHAVAGRLFDLLPVTRAAYYHPAMRGSWSIKAVLPTLEPALGYETLTEIQDGEAAQLAFLEMRDPATDAARREELAARSRRYCERDTYAMVVLKQFLCSM
jgi:Domain of unknown function(DUF2779)